ncbi:molybdate ABC transporter substrate-binding protein [Mariprofundus erugo]|uniref:Molybdate ABC transporter substrate-binding protein n=1 Tax=Mariprofundus erugo TaxID=2528639 RepID=A0A5R9GEB5_9PROT|nr:molybdate ABC transporter substrate-binding protein [Mariprofundus erugo]TLS65466.1 molybdate ABC transporter substrate-binding protein [Mariprofundus erugo]
MKALLLLLSLIVGVMPAMAGEVSVAVAANFTNAMHELAPLFEKATGHTLKVSFGSTGKLYAQIENSAPFEVFLAADTKRPEKAEAAGLAVPGSRFTYASGKLAMWSAKPGAWRDAEAWLKQAAFAHLAIANPKTAPYGLAAQQVMRHLGLWDVAQPKLVQGDSIAQTFQFVATGNAEAGFVAASQVKAWKGGGMVWEVPQAYYPPIEQQAVLLTKGADDAAARAFLDFLQSDAARAVIRSFGYGVSE